MSDTDGSPLEYILRNYALPREISLIGGLALVFLSQIPHQVPAVLIGVTLDGILLESEAFVIPLLPEAWIPATPMRQLGITIILLAGAVVTASGLHWLGNYIYGKAKLQVLHDLRVDTYKNLVNTRMSYFDKENSADIMSIINNDVNNMEDLAVSARDGVDYAGQLVIAFAFMLFLQWELTLVIVAIPLLIWISSRIYASLLQPRYERVRASVGEVNVRLRETISGISTVKAFSQEPFERRRVHDASDKYKTHRWSTIRLRLGYNSAIFSVASIGTWGVFLIGCYWIFSGPPLFFSQSLTAGTLLTFLIYTQSFLEPSRRLAVDVIDKFENAVASSKRVGTVLQNSAVRSDPTDGTELDVSDGRIAYDGVSFRYEGAEEWSVENVSFQVEPGEFVGIVGPTGAGKSTLLKLLLRFYEPDRGTVSIDGQDITNCTVHSVREELGYVSQDPFLFNDTIRSNIAYMKSTATHEDVVEAAKVAGAHEFIDEELPDGYETTVGEGGAKLSGGQRQRIAIARVLLHDPPILIFDEATSHVDNETQHLIKQRIETFADDRTVFTIAHNLSVIHNADKILVFNDGNLEEVGTHDELVAQSGTYSDLWQVQSGNFESVSDEFLLGTDDETEVAK